ncbi:MAG: hypothetical protein LQ348_003647 [Seirophora lacunosa]|nr:MAG: hypothetical protein LQ348_003647 [Seirophora lacunosa]
MIWVACNYKNGHILSVNVIRKLVLLSLFNYQVDEYMKDSVKKRKANGGKANNFQNGLPEQSAVAQSFELLSRFIQHVAQHCKRAYIDWVRTTASDDTSCPFSFLFFTALISEGGRICFEGAQASYVSKSLCRQLATMCRQYNDYGSAKRDAEECNLNSLAYPEFRSHTNRADGCSKANSSDVPVVRPEDGNVASPARAASNEQQSGENEAKTPENASAKEDLMAIAEFERSCMQLALEKLTRISPPATVHKPQIFIDVTDMFGQIYVQRDIASRVQKTSK